MTHNAQQAYDAHVATQKANWSTMTTDQQDASLRTEKTLQLAAELEARDNQLEEQQQAEQTAAEQRAELIAEMKTNGYTGEGTVEDFKKLFKPSIFGGNHEQKAIDAYNNGADFVTLYQQYGNL